MNPAKPINPAPQTPNPQVAPTPADQPLPSSGSAQTSDPQPLTTSQPAAPKSHKTLLIAGIVVIVLALFGVGGVYLALSSNKQQRTDAITFIKDLQAGNGSAAYAMTSSAFDATTTLAPVSIYCNARTAGVTKEQA